MRRLLVAGLLAGVLVGGFFVWQSQRARAAETGFNGTWTVAVMPAGQEITLWLVKVEEKDGKPQATLLSAGLPTLKDTKLDAFKVEGNALKMTMKVKDTPFVITAYQPARDASPKRLLGSIETPRSRDLIRMERSELKELDPEKTIAKGPGDEALATALMEGDPKKQEAALKAVAEKHAGHPSAYHASLSLIESAVDQETPEAEVRTRGDQALKAAVPYGREMEMHAASQIGELLLTSDKLAPLALDFAQRAEKLLGKDESTDTQLRILRGLKTALTKAKRDEEAKKVDERLAKLEEALDQEYLKKVPPFKPEAFTGRKGPSSRVAVVELFTGTQCPPCVAADVAFDAALKTFKPAEVIFLQYHLHIPGPDPLTNEQTEKRSEFYEVEGTPSVFLNGKPVEGMGGLMQHAEDRYKKLRKAAETDLESEAGAKLTLTAERKGDEIKVSAEVADLKKPGENTRLRLLLVEDVVRYPAPNGQRFHHHVVRALPGGVEGFALKDKTGKQNVLVELAEVRKSINDYLTEYTKKRRFPSDDRPLDLKNLKVVALIQDLQSKEILQAAQIDVPEAK